MRGKIFTSEGQFNQEAWDQLGQPVAPADMPSSADAYSLPEIEGFDHEQASQSPLFASLRTAAFEGGMGQAQFEKAIKTYVEGEMEAATADATAQMAALGDNAQKRIDTVSSFLSRSLPADEYKAILPATGSAKGIAALERLMNLRASPRPGGDPPPNVPTKSKEEIEKIMQSDEYRGTPGKPPDPAVRKEVDDWFAANSGE